VARGDADADSDIDLLCLLNGPVNTIKETLYITGELYPLQLKYLDRPISVMAVDAADYDEGSYPLVIEAKKEGMPV
jgi:predicted nucleotidyltransferase